MGAVEYLLLITLSALWGGSFFFSEVALAELPPFTVVFGRVFVGAGVLWIVVFASGERLPGNPGIWLAFFAMGILNNVVPFSLIVWGQTQIASGLAAILNATTPLFTVVIAHYLSSDERLTPNRMAGVLVGFAGVAVMIGPEMLAGLSVNVIAQLAVLGAALSYGFAAIFGRRFKGTPPVITAAGQLGCSAAVMLPLTLLVDAPWLLPAPGVTTWGAILGLAMLSTAAAYVIYFRLLASAGPTNLLLVTFLIPVSALLLGTFVLGEQLQAKHFLGMALIGMGLGAIDGRPVRILRSRLAAGSTP
jgi:drug/metabolite transporter (DMT)-like permease